MPLTLNTAETIVLDTVQITQFQVTPNGGHIVIHYSVGHTDSTGKFIPKKGEMATFKGVEFETALYESVKTKLYELLNERLNSPLPSTP